MGTVIRLQDSKKGTQRWQVMIRRAGAVFQSAKFSSEEAARAQEAEWEQAIAERRALKSEALPASGRLEDEALAKTLGLYLNSDKCTKQHRGVLPSVARLVDPELLLGELTPGWVEDYIDRMRATTTYRGDVYSYSTIQKHLVFANLAIKWRARRMGVPAPTFEFSTRKMFPRGWENERERRVELFEERRIMAHFRAMKQPSRHQWKLAFRLAMETGARLQELVLARWSEFNTDGTFWTIPGDHTKGGSTRVMALTMTARRIVRLLRRYADPLDPRVFHLLPDPGCFSVEFSRWMRKLGIVDLTFRDTRHEGISRFVLTQRNYTIFEIMDMVGHSSMEMTRRYANLRGDELAAKII